MPIDTSIIARLQSPQIQQQDPIAQYAKGLQLKQMLTEQQAQQRALADETAQRTAFQESGGDSAKYLQALASGGNYKAYQAAQAQDLARQKALADVAHLGAQTGQANATAQKTLTDTQAAKILQHRDQLSNVSNPQDAQAWIQQGVSTGVFTPEMAQAGMAKLQNSTDFNQWKNEAALGATKYIEQNKPTYQTRNLGGTTQTLSLPGLGGAPTVASTAQNTASPGEILSSQNAAAGRALSSSQFAATNALAKDRLEFDKTKVSPTDKKATAGAEAKINEAKDVLALLDQATPLIDKATSSYAGAALNQGARLFGKSTEGGNAAAQLRALEGALISKMPKMSGPQSDKDVLLYKQMAGQIGDPTIPADQKKAAMQTIREINERAAGGAPAATKAGANVSNW